MLFCAFRPQTYAETVTTTRSDAFYAPLLDEETDTDSEVNTDVSVTPFVKAGFFSRMSFWWLNPLLTKGKGKILEDKDIPKLRKVDRAETSERYSNVRFLCIGQGSCSKVGPLLLKAFIRVAQGKETFKIIGLQVRSSLSATIYQKQLRISNASKPTHSPGERTNYVTVDAYRIVVLVITLTVLGNYPMGNLQHKHLTKLLVSRDRRLKAIAEALANMKEPVRLIPDVVSEFIEANAAFTRIVKFLEAPELHNRHIGGDTGSRPPIIRVYSYRSKKAYPVLLWLVSGLLTGPDA
ncbi:multidrug resistance-associated protein 14 [Actinidia rufa]|uniref:Multidrug resistance-associated protein 14 n=1 Tax=Actinidia rufa TaxID=165716 RepID=A0A7J0DU34_9ERIC|nr:multidrug resistance-associated protein 14 [Actinidia rufa]